MAARTHVRSVVTTANCRAAVLLPFALLIALLTPVSASAGQDHGLNKRSAHVLAGASREMTHFEVAGPGGAGTFTNYTNAGGYLAVRIAPYQGVQVTCALTGFRVADGNTWWYQIASSPWNNAYYSSADDFYNNGATSGSLNGTPFVDPAVPICGSAPPSGGGDGGGGGGGGGTTTTSAQWQVTGPQLSYNLFLGSPYAISFTIKNVGNASGTFSIADSDSACTGPRLPLSLQPGQSAQWRFVCVQKWNWIVPFNEPAWKIAWDGTGGTVANVYDFVHGALTIVTNVRDALRSLHVPSKVTNSLLGLDDAGTVISILNNGFQFIEDHRETLLITQRKIWRPTFTSNFTYSPAVAGAPASLGVPVSVPTYKWDAYTSFTRTETSAIAFDLAGVVTGQLESHMKNPFVRAALFFASETCAFLAKRGHDTAKLIYTAAYDPAMDYQTPPSVSYTPTLYLDSLPNGPMKDWAIAYSHALDVEVARGDALVRYAGAVEAQDDAAQTVQLDALQQLNAQEQNLLTSNAAGEQQLLAQLPADFTNDDQQAVLGALADPGFVNSDIGQTLVAAGASPSDVADLASTLAQELTPGDPVDLQAALSAGIDQSDALLQDEAVDTSLRLGDTQADSGQPAAYVSLGAAPGDDGLYHAPVTATAATAPNSAAVDHIEYSLDGGAFTPYNASVTVSSAGTHTFVARAVGTNGIVQDPAASTAFTIAAQHAPPVAEIGTPYVALDAPHGLPVTLTLDASESHDVNGDPLTYGWSFDDAGGTTDNGATDVVTHTFTHYGVFKAHLTVSNGYFTSGADATVDVVDSTPPTLTAPANASFVDGSDVAQKIDGWLSSAVASDDDPSGTVTISNDYAAKPVVGTPTTVTWTAIDAAGNTSHATAILTVLDGTPPAIQPQVDGMPGKNGWYTSDVSVHWQVNDPESAITASSGCTDAAVSSDTSADGIAFTCTATSVGGTSSQTVVVKRDTTPPTISATRRPAPNAAGWNNSDVTVTYSCADASSGIVSCPAANVLGQGTAQVASATAVDAAGNQATATVDDINVDETPPTLSGAPTTSPNPAGWYNGDVTIHWTCADTGGSGIEGSCPPDSTISGEGSSLTASSHLADVAGNLTSATTSAIKIDRSPPETAITAPSGWTNRDVTAVLSATDNLSGVAATFYSLDGAPVQTGTNFTITSEGRHTVEYWSTDNAGNNEEHHTVTILIDKTPPTIAHVATPAVNAAGWNNTDVAVSFTCSDALSGVESCTIPQLLTGEGQAIPVVGTALDNAGNTTLDTTYVSIDKTPPTITAAADRVPNTNGWYNANVTVDFTCTDALSGISTCPSAITLGEGANQSASGTATDAAGNHASRTLGDINIDETPPTVTYSGNAGTYTVDQPVAITCTASDALSGLASTTCANISGPAWSFGLGTTSRTARAVDKADNTASGSVSFTIAVTCSSLQALINRFSTNSDVASGLDAKIDALCNAHNANAKAGALGAFDNQLAAQTGKALTASQAALLKQFADAL